MEERALYRAILDAPHDDAPRLVYADWLDEHADRFPEPHARVERARAEFIRLQCERTRRTPAGWRTEPRPVAPELSRRERRLLLQHGRKWRRALPIGLASSSFDRGFLRPFRALRPLQFLRQLPFRAPLSDVLLLTVPEASPARRYLPEDDLFATCPLWDLHLFATGWHNDPLADHGQYETLLAETANSPALARVGWLKLSFFRTPVLDFLRTGNFANVETLVLNAGPFPEVLEAVAENESFRSLRYVWFGEDRWAWAPTYPRMLQYLALADKLRTANNRHLPFGEMRSALRNILHDTPLVPVARPTEPVDIPAPLRTPTWRSVGGAPPGAANPNHGTIWLLVVFSLLALRVATYEEPEPPAPAFNFATDRHKVPPSVFDLPAMRPAPVEVPLPLAPPPRPAEPRTEK